MYEHSFYGGQKLKHKPTNFRTRTMKTTPLQAIRRHCLSCNHTSKEVKLCPVIDCSLYIFRFGKGEGKGSRLKEIRKRCIQCAETLTEIRNCPIKDCHLRPYRRGNNPALKGKRGKGNRNIALLRKNSLNHCANFQQTGVNP